VFDSLTAVARFGNDLERAPLIGREHLADALPNDGTIVGNQDANDARRVHDVTGTRTVSVAAAGRDSSSTEPRSGITPRPLSWTVSVSASSAMVAEIA
jgi:hypothetical protein